MDTSDQTTLLDPIDLRLLDLLQADAARSNQALAEAAHVSPATALRRVRRLVDTGVVQRQVAIVDPQRVGGLTALVEVSLDHQGAEHLAAFEARAVADRAVQQCYRVSPGPDFVLVLWLADMPAYHALVQRLFTQDANVRNVKTFFATHRAKFEPAVGLAESVRIFRSCPLSTAAAPGLSGIHLRETPACWGGLARPPAAAGSRR